MPDHAGPFGCSVAAGRPGHLGVEIAVPGHTRQLHHALQLDFAPAPTYLRRSKGRDQLTGLAVQLERGALHACDLFAQTRIRVDAVMLDLLDVLVQCADRFAQRIDHGADSLRMPARRILVGRAERLS
jgi:hypothetical protein